MSARARGRRPSRCRCSTRPSHQGGARRPGGAGGRGPRGAGSSAGAARPAPTGCCGRPIPPIGAVLQQSPAAVTLSFTEAPEPRLLVGAGARRRRALVRRGRRCSRSTGDPGDARLGRCEPLAQGCVHRELADRVPGRRAPHRRDRSPSACRTPVTTDAAAAPPGRRSAHRPTGRWPPSADGSCSTPAWPASSAAAWIGASPSSAGAAPGPARAGWRPDGSAAAVGVVGHRAWPSAASTGVSLGVFLQTRLGRSVLWRLGGLAVAAGWASSWPAVATGGGGGAGMGLVAAGTAGRDRGPRRVRPRRRRPRRPWADGRPAGRPRGRDGRVDRRPGRPPPRPAPPAVGAGGDAGGGDARRGRGDATDGATRRWRPVGRVAARRFSAVAVAAVATLVVTGVLRAIDAVGGWGPLWRLRLRTAGAGQVGAAPRAIAGLGRCQPLPPRPRRRTLAHRAPTGRDRRGGGGRRRPRRHRLPHDVARRRPRPARRRPRWWSPTSDFGTTVQARLAVVAGPGRREPLHRPAGRLRHRRAGRRRPGSRPGSSCPPSPVPARRASSCLPPARHLRRVRRQPRRSPAGGGSSLVVERGADSLELHRRPA